jgi:hypothetical protein
VAQECQRGSLVGEEACSGQVTNEVAFCHSASAPRLTTAIGAVQPAVVPTRSGRLHAFAVESICAMIQCVAASQKMLWQPRFR